MGGHALGEFASRTNDITDNLTLQTENIAVQNSAPGVRINAGPVQNALTINPAPIAPRP